MTVYELLIDSTASLSSRADSWGLFSTEEKAKVKLNSIDWVQDWMFVEIKERKVD